MKKNFFSRFETQEKMAPRSVSMSVTDWQLVEAYRYYGASKAGHNLSFQKLMREIVVGHIIGDKEFAKNKIEWMKQVASLDKTQEGVLDA